MSNSAFTPAVLTIPAAATTATGELNVISNPSAASLSTTGWTGVTAVGTNSPLNPTVTTAFSIANTAGAESSTSGGYASFTMPSGLQNKKLKVEFYFTTPATDVYKVSVYKGGSRVTLTTDSSGSTTLLASTTGKFVAYFDTDTTANWTVNITRTSGSTGPIYVTNVIVGPGIQPQGAVVGEWTSYTPTWTGLGTVTNQVAQYRRVGSNLELIVRTLSGTADGSNLSVSLPSGLTSSALNQIVIVGYGKSNGTTVSLTVAVNSSASNTLLIGDFTASFFSQIIGTAIGNSKVVDIQATIPITEWASSGTVQLAQNDVEWAWNSSTSTTTDSTSFGYGPQGVLVQSFAPSGTNAVSKRVRFQTPIQSSDVLTLEIQDGSGLWVPYANRSFGYASNEAATVLIGANINVINSTDVDVNFYSRYSWLSAWSAVNTFKWRVRKSSAGAAVGFSIVSSSSAGLLPVSNSNLDDATATRLGLKQYLHGTTYNGGNAPTVTGGANITTLGTVRRAVFIPYQMQDGTWRMRFTIRIDGTTSVSAVGHQFGIAGITFKNNTNWNQTLAGFSDASNQTGALAVNNSNAIDLGHGTAVSPTIYGFSGDVELESKPTWAY